MNNNFHKPTVIYVPDTTYFLSNRQMEVLEKLANGYSTKQIAFAMGLSQRTIMAHVTDLKNKMNCGNRCQIIAKAFMAHILVPGPDELVLINHIFHKGKVPA